MKHRAILICGLVLFALALVGFNVLKNREPVPPVSSNPEGASLVRLIAEQTDRLGVKPATVPLTSELAFDVRRAVKLGKYVEAEKIASDVLARSELRAWSFSPFSIFLSSFEKAGVDPDLLSHLDEWVSASPGHALPLILRAAYHIQSAWAIRGRDFSSTVDPTHLASFELEMQQAAADARQAIEIDPNVPPYWHIWVRTEAVNGNSRSLEYAFQDAIHKFPTYYPLYSERLDKLQPKWGGSIKAMAVFTGYYAGAAPAHAPLKMLYLQLFGHLLDAARVDCIPARSRDANEACVTRALDQSKIPGLDERIAQAFDLYKFSDPEQFNAVVAPLFSQMAGANSNVTQTILQQAAHSTDSNAQMADDHPGHNNYLIDIFAGQLWQEAGYNENAEHKYQEALLDIQHFKFSTEESRMTETARIYWHLQDLAEESKQFDKEIVYYNAVEMLGGPHYKEGVLIRCYAWHELKQYEKSIQECTRQLDERTDAYPARYWRARGYDKLGKTDQALAELQIVADSESNFRSSAAIDMSVIYANKNDVQASLQALQSHPFLFDVQHQSRGMLSVAFNNRCYAYMQLDRLREALDDCNTSLKYGNLPDAVQKQQVLLKKLRDQAPSPAPGGTD